MAKFTSDSFLPSGAVEEPRLPAFAPRSQLIPQQGGSRMSPPRPKAYPTLLSPQSHDFQFPPRSNHSSGPISPPVSRSTSVDGTNNNNWQSIETWREYTSNLREQARGERAHMLADRARMEELMEEERSLGRDERAVYESMIAALRAEVSALKSTLASAPPGTSGRSTRAVTSPSIYWHGSQSTMSSPLNAAINSGNLVASTIDTAARMIPQESGRNPDGTPFYAPASRHPSRTFQTSESDELRVESTPAPGETPLRITKELTGSDFGVQSSQQEQSQEGSVTGDSIDISLIQPELDGVPIKSTAVKPNFVSKVLSPNSSSMSPARLSPNVVPPSRPSNISNGLISPPISRPSTLEVMAVPEFHRRTMNAGHTPTHSIHKFDLGDSGNATPTQQDHKPHRPSEVTNIQQLDDISDPDPALTGQLCLMNDPPLDNLFLGGVDSKLLYFKRTRPSSVSEASVTNGDMAETAYGIPAPSFGNENKVPVVSAVEPLGHNSATQITAPSGTNAGNGNGADADSEGPKLRVRPNTNFGKPFGRF